MKFKTLFLGLLFLLIGNLSQAKQRPDEREQIRNNFPKLEEVLSYLNRTLEYECNNCGYGVAKKRDGYYLTLRDYDTKITSEVPIWKASTARFVDYNISNRVDPTKSRSTNNSDLNQLYNNREKNDFMLFFGYDNWATDVIHLLATYNETLSNQDLELLARAHGEVAQQIIDANNELRTYNRIDRDKLDSFVEEAEISMGFWKQIKKQDETYSPLIINDLDLKIGNDYMHYYMLLLSIKDENAANKFLNNAWFTPSQVQSAKNILFSCPEDGFLFTEGDADTYPLWYAQNKLDYRKDVIVINTSLLNNSWYLQMTKERFGYASTLNHYNYKKLLKKTQYIDADSTIVPYNQWLTKRLSEEGVSDSYYEIIPRAFIIPLQGSNLEINFKQEGVDQASLSLLDIIANNTARQFNFVNFYQLYTFGLENNYLSRGKSCTLTGTTVQTTTDKKSIEQLDNLLNYMDAGYLKSLSEQGVKELNILCYGISLLSRDFVNDQQRLTEKLIKQLPIKVVLDQENYDLIEIMNSFYERHAPIQSVKLKKSLEQTASDRIKEISAVNKSLDKDLIDLENLFSIYAGTQFQWIQFEDVLVSKDDRSILREIKVKIDQLNESPIIEQREWTRLRIAAFKEAIDKLDLTQL